MPSWSATIEGVRVAAHHARPGSDMNGVMPDATADEVDEVLKAALEESPVGRAPPPPEPLPPPGAKEVRV